MRKLTLGIIACAAALGGCAPLLHLAQSPGGCAPMQRAAHHRTSIMATLQKVQQVQARSSLSASFVRSNPNAWRAAATRECR